MKLTIISLLSFVTFAAHALDKESPGAAEAVNTGYVRNLCEALHPSTADDCLQDYYQLNDPNHELTTSIVDAQISANEKAQ